MRLVIREYLSMLKESGELDVLIPDLLLSMGIIPLSKAQVGVRQHGVDISGVGLDSEDNNIKKLFLFTIKQGDFSRKIWDDGTPQAIRPSLNEICDVYIPGIINNQHKKLPKKVIVCCGGDLKQDVENNWKGYQAKQTQPGDLEFELWDGNKLTILIEQFLLDEYLFTISVQKYLRKTIALVDQNEDEPRYFYALIEEILFKSDLPKEKKAIASILKALSILNLSLNIVFHWCQEANNLKPALLCAERTILRTWEWMRQNELFNRKKIVSKFDQIFSTYIKVADTYATKLEPHCFVRDGLFGYGADELEYPLRTFEVIGILGTLGMALNNLFIISSDEQQRQIYQTHMRRVVNMLAALIENNPSALTPYYDSHSIEISLGILSLSVAGYINQAAYWLIELGYSIVFAYRIGKHFPIDSDSYDDLVSMAVGQAPAKEKLMEASTLIPILAGWYAVLNLAGYYEDFQQAVTQTFTKTHLQLWFPDQDTDKYLYSVNAGYASGFSFHPFKLPQTLDELKTYIVTLRDKYQIYADISCLKLGLFIIPLIASRHFRTPIIPAFWQKNVRDTQVSEDENAENLN